MKPVRLLFLIFNFMIIIFLTQVSFAKDKIPSFGEFGLFGVPLLGFELGSYEFGDGTDKGSLQIGYAGGKAGFKVGFIFFGGEFLKSLPKSYSDKVPYTPDPNVYPKIDDQLTSYGPTLGIQIGRISAWVTYYLSEEALTTGLKWGPESFEHTYHGTGAKIALGWDIGANTSVNISAHQRVFDKFSSKFSSNLGDKSRLPSALTATTYGIYFAYTAKAENMVSFDN